MPNKGWLKEVLADARKEVNSRPEWQKNRVIAAEHQDRYAVNEPCTAGKSPDQVTAIRTHE